MIPLMIKVKPGSSKDEISFDTDGTLTVKIRERPVDGAANAYLLKYLSKEFKLSKSRIVLEKGTTSRFKKILLDTDQAAIDQIFLSIKEKEKKN